MPRKLRPGKRRTETIAHLSPDTIAVLLDGWSATAPVASPHGFGGGFLQLYEANDAGILRLWTTHREALLTQAEAWGWTPRWELEDGTVGFFGDYLQRGNR